MDFPVFALSLHISLLKESTVALFHPFWYSMLKDIPVSDSTPQCLVASKLPVSWYKWTGCCQSWQQMASRASILETAPWSPTSVLGTPVWLNGSYAHEQFMNGLHRPQDDTNNPSACAIAQLQVLACSQQSLGGMAYWNLQNPEQGSQDRISLVSWRPSSHPLWALHSCSFCWCLLLTDTHAEVVWYVQTP